MNDSIASTAQPSLAMEVSKLRLKFPDSPTLLFRDFDFAVPQGQKLLLLGPSGCGKSTLLQVLSGLIPNAVEIPMKTAHVSLPEQWGFVFQDPDTQFCMPFVDEELAFVLENLSVPRQEMKGRMEAVLQEVGLMLDELHFPIQALSQGMKQRLALASVMLLEPEVLFLDEPSALLDPDGTAQIWEALQRVSKGKTVVIIEHKIDQVISFVDRVVLFDELCQIIADGDPQAVFEAHREQLMRYGIWYPNVWQDYIASSSFKAISHVREHEATLLDSGKRESLRAVACAKGTFGELKKPLLALEAFCGLRNKEVKIQVDSAQVMTGEWVTIVGPNGAGKSTLLQAIRQLLPTKGKAFLEGNRLYKKSELSTLVSFVFQNPELQFLTNSLYDELAYAPPY